MRMPQLSFRHVALPTIRWLLPALVWISTPLDAAPARSDLQTVSVTSPSLSRFWRASQAISAVIYVPPACVGAKPRCPVLYHIPGAWQTLDSAWETVNQFALAAERDTGLKIAQVVLDPNALGRPSYFVDSANNGPWRTALMRDLIPLVESRYGIGGSATLRYLHGHSSGGWAVLALQIAYPATFNGAWGIAPDVVDFINFYHTNVQPGPPQNFYTFANGQPKYLWRGANITARDWMQQWDDNPTYGGLISPYEYAWSARARDGKPYKLFDRTSGSVTAGVTSQWSRHDLLRQLQTGGARLKPLLAGKLNVYCGTNDDYWLNESTASLCSFLSAAGYQSRCELIAGRTHDSVYDPSRSYPQGLRSLIVSQLADRIGPTPINTPPTTPPSPNTNLARARPVTASSQANLGSRASSAVDGTISTAWTSAATNPQWIQVNLGARYNISRIKMVWGTTFSTYYKIQTSNDGVRWTDLYSTTNGSGGTTDLTSVTGTGQFVRIYCLTRNSVSFGHSIRELEVYGTPWR